MDDTDDDDSYPPKSYTLNPLTAKKKKKSASRSSHRPLPSFYNHRHDDVQNEEVDEDDDDDDNDNFVWYPKRIKQLKKPSVSNYEFLARRRRNNNHSSESDFSGVWNDEDTSVLLEVWGERFLELGRHSLRSEDWVEVASKVSEALGIERTEGQCREMMDSLKKRYRKEQGKSKKWSFYRKMDMLMRRQENRNVHSLCCGLDSGEYVFMDTGFYLQRANGNDEMSDSPCDSEEDDDDTASGDTDMFKGLTVLAESFRKFGETYKRIESVKKEQMLELERMRGDFQAELELQRKQILEIALAEIAKIRDEDDEDDDDDDDDTDPESNVHKERKAEDESGGDDSGVNIS